MDDKDRPTPPGLVAKLAVVAMGLAAAGLVLLGTAKYGPGLWPDGTNLLWAAKNVIAGRGFLASDGQPMVEWPPLFPALVALASVGRIDTWSAVRFMNALSFGLIIFLAGKVFLGSFRLRSLALLGTAAILISHPLAAVAVMAWPDTLLNLFVVLFLVLFSRFAVAPRVSTFIPVCLVVTGACLAHYSGVSVALASIVAVALMPGVRPGTRFAYAATLGMSGLGPLAAWLGRNISLTGTLAGTRVPVTRVHFLEGVLTALREWFFQPRLTRWLGILGLVLSVVLVVVLVLLVLRRNRRRTDRLAWFGRTSVVWLAAFGAFLLVPEPPMNFDPIPDRVMVPAFVVTIYLLISGLDWLASYLSRKLSHARLAELASLALGLLWLSYPLTHVSTVYGNWVTYGTGGYNSDQWRESATVKWLQANPPPTELRVFTNEPLALRVCVGIPAERSPLRKDDLVSFRRSLGSSPALLVWFKNTSSNALATPAELGRALKVEPGNIRLPDAEIYRIRPESSELRKP